MRAWGPNPAGGRPRPRSCHIDSGCQLGEIATDFVKELGAN
jgi:hypothetical protein